MDRLLTREQVAELLGVKTQTLSVWASTGRYELPYHKIGRHVRYKESDVIRWLEGRRQTQTA